jgi:hypothetical protein
MEDALFTQVKWWQERALFFKNQQGYEAFQEFTYCMEQSAHYLNLILITSDPSIVNCAYALVLLKLSKL